MTKREFDNTLRDLLGVTTGPAATNVSFIADQSAGHSGFVRGGSITGGQDARLFMTTAEQVATAALQRMPGLLPCAPVPTAVPEQDACADRFIAGFARRAFRRPPLAKEIDGLKALYRAQRAPAAGASFNEAIANIIAAILQSPQFLYRWELGPSAPTLEGGLARFNSHEMASRLSYLIWASMPDDKLFAAADAGQLATADQITREARRLIADPKARQALADFHVQWLQIGAVAELQKDPALKLFTPQSGQAMTKELEEFVASVFIGPAATGKLETLLTSPASFVDVSLSKIYGVAGVTTAELKPVNLNPMERAGILTQAAFLASHADASDSHPIRRGDTILNRLACMHLEIPANVMVPPLPEPKPGQTTRERVAFHSMAACATCHKLIDPIGFAFENYDAVGAYRAMEEGKRVDASGVFPLGGGDLKFTNAVQLVGLLAKTKEIQDCMATQWLRYGLRREEVPTEAPSLALAQGVFRQSGYDLRELVVALTRTRAFTHRKLSVGEVSQ